MDLIAGVDEVGRGCLAGPVMAAAVILPTNHSIIGLKDSKKLTEKKRNLLFSEIKNNALAIGIGSVSVKIIDKINIRKASFKAMGLALDNLPIKPKKALIDGFSLDNYSIPNVGIKGGDNKIDNIKAASIFAKVTRDNLMYQYGLIFKEYDIGNNKGYGTKVHINAIRKYKASPIHRKTFNPVFLNLVKLKWFLDNDRILWIGNRLAGLAILKMKFKIISVIENGCNSNRMYFVEKNKIKRIFIVFTTFKKKGNLYNGEKSLIKNNFSELVKEILFANHIEENNFRFNIINVILHNNGYTINYIKNIPFK